MLVGQTIYLIMYNYSGNEYSTVKVMSSLESAVEHIKSESDNADVNVLNVKKTRDVPKDADDDVLYVCNIVNGNYSDFELCDLECVSPLVIVPMKIE